MTDQFTSSLKPCLIFRGSVYARWNRRLRDRWPKPTWKWAWAGHEGRAECTSILYCCNILFGSHCENLTSNDTSISNIYPRSLAFSLSEPIISAMPSLMSETNSIVSPIFEPLSLSEKAPIVSQEAIPSPASEKAAPLQLTAMHSTTSEQRPDLPRKNWTMGDAFMARGKHHDSIRTLWETMWKMRVRASRRVQLDARIIQSWPLWAVRQRHLPLSRWQIGGLCQRLWLSGQSAKSFSLVETIDQYFIQNNINDGYSDAYTEAFFPTCDTLLEQADAIAASDSPGSAAGIYLRIACLYRISRFPIMNSPVKWKAWEAQKAAYMKATSAWVDPLKEEVIPHRYAEGADGPTIPLYVRVPVNTTSKKPIPTVLLMTGLDGYRPDNTQRTHEFVSRGWGCVIAEIPGTADCPANPKDPQSADRLWDSILDWMSKKGIFNMKQVVIWGLSCGGYYAVRIAHTHKERLIGSVAQGAGIHHWFDREWLSHADDHEYPFASVLNFYLCLFPPLLLDIRHGECRLMNSCSLTPALAQKFGYDTVEDFMKESQKNFSLVDSGIVLQPSARLLLINVSEIICLPNSMNYPRATTNQFD